MTSLSISVNSDNLMRAIAQVPQKLEKEMGVAMLFIGKKMAHSARSKAPQAMGTLLKSINNTHPTPYETVIAPGVDYGRVVEEKTRGGVMPPVQNILDWIKVKRITPNHADMDQKDLAFVIARSIALRGTPAQPYLQPAFDENKLMAEKQINNAIERALQ